MAQKTIALDYFVWKDLLEIKTEKKLANFTETVQFLIKEHKTKQLLIPKL